MKFYSENQIMEIPYDTSFQPRLKCVIDGTEYNRGPISFVESYREKIYKTIINLVSFILHLSGLLFFVHELYMMISNSQNKIIRVIFYGIRPLHMVNETPKRKGGRPKKKKNFNFMPKKLKLDPPVIDDDVPTSSTNIDISNALTTKHYLALNIDYSLITDETLNRKPIVKLENNLVNRCFFNSRTISNNENYE